MDKKASLSGHACRRAALAWFGSFLAVAAQAGVNRWTTAGPLVGSITVIASDPADPTHLYAGTTTDGAFQSRDGGATWIASNGSQPASWVLSIQPDPSNPLVVYAGILNGGVLKSLDGGNTWTNSSLGLGGYGLYPTAVAIDPATPSTILISTLDGVWRSVDGACTWTLSSNGLPISNGSFYTQTLVQNPGNPDVLYLGSEFNGVFQSVDRGQTWTPLFSPFFQSSVNAIAIDPTNPSTLYLAASYGDPKAGTSGGGVFKSIDGGASWDAGTSPGNLPFRSVALDPANSLRVWAASSTQAIFRSDDGGATWSPASAGLTDVSVDALLAPAGSPFVYAGTVGSGVFRSGDGGDSWSASDPGMQAYLGFAVLADSSTAGVAYAAGYPYGAAIAKTTDGGTTWTPAITGLTPSMGAESLAIDPTAPSTVYAGFESFNGIFKSANAGQSWTLSASATDSAYHAIVVDPSNPSTVHAAGDHGFWRTTDAGATWIETTPTEYEATALVLHPSAPTTLYGAAFGVLKSVDGGDTWNPSGDGLGSIQVISLAVAPDDPNVLLAGTAGGPIFRSADGAVSWTPTSGVPPNTAAVSIAFDPSNTAVVYAGIVDDIGFLTQGTAAGVLRSTDGGLTWNSFNEGLPRSGLNGRTVYGLSIDPASGLIYASTGAGVYTRQPSDVPPPVLAAVTPDSAPGSAAAPVLLTGTGFSAGASVLVDGAPATGVVVVDDSHIQASLPPGPPGSISSIAIVNPDSQVAESERAFLRDYLDVPSSAPYSSDVARLSLSGITAGCGMGIFCPTAAVSRAQTAVLLEKTLHGPDFLFPPPGGVFRDVDRCAPSARYIYAFLDDGLTAGCAPARFCPGSPVTRAQIAVFLLLGEHGTGYVPPPATGTVFGDVHVGDFAADFIEQLAHEGITAGCGGGDFCPGAPVTRAQIAVFLVRMFNL